MRTGSEGHSVSSAGGVETTANEATRNFILGLPKDGPAPGSHEAASLQAAEAFVSEIQREILAYDIANARAAEAYARSWWEKVPYFGKRWAAAADQLESTTFESYPTMDTATAATATATATAAAASSREAPMRGQFHVERTAASVDGMPMTKKRPVRMNTWLFKQCRPGWVPLIQRWWVPYLCVAGMCVLWTPDSWKLRTLYWVDHKYAIFRQEVHKAYWWATMSVEDYNDLMEDLNLDRPRSVKATNCPL